LEQGVAVLRTESSEPGDSVAAPVDAEAPLRTVDDVLIVHQRLISGALAAGGASAGR
jgi:hypothetical protein